MNTIDLEKISMDYYLDNYDSNNLVKVLNGIDFANISMSDKFILVNRVLGYSVEKQIQFVLDLLDELDSEKVRGQDSYIKNITSFLGRSCFKEHGEFIKLLVDDSSILSEEEKSERLIELWDSIDNK